MAEAQLELDIAPALQAIEEINAAFDAAATNFSTQLSGVLTDALNPQIAEIGSELDAAFAGLPDQLSSAFDGIDLSNIEPPDFTSANDELAGLSENLDSVGEASERTRSAFNLQDSATSALEIATGTLEGSSSSLLRTLVPGVAIFGGITAAVAGLVEKGDKAILATERMNQVFGDAAPGVFNTRIAGLNFTLDDLDKKSGTSGSAMKLLLATFGDTAVASGYTREQAAGLSTEMGGLAQKVSILNPTLGTASDILPLLQRGLGGSTRLLQRFGITIDQARLAQDALTIANEHGRDKASLMDKQVAGLALANEALEEKARLAGTTVEGLLNKGLESSTIKFRALKQEVSASLTAIGTPIVEAGLAITQAFTPAIEGVIGLFGGIVDAVVPVLAPLATKFGEAIQPIIDKVPEFVAAVAPIFTGLINAFSPLLDLVGPLVAEFLEFGAALLKVATPFILDFFKGVASGIQTIVDVTKDVVEWLGDHLGGVLTDLQPLLDKFGINGHDIASNLGEAAVAAGAGAIAFKVFGFGIDQVSTVLQTVGAGLDILLANPWVAVIAALAAAFFILYQNSEDFRDIIHEIGDFFSTEFIPDLETGYEVVSDFAKVVGGELYDGLQVVSGVLDDIAATNTFQAIEDVAQAFADLFEALGPIGQIIVVVGAIGGIAAALGPLGVTLPLLVSPIGLIVAGVAALALVAVTLYENFQPVTDLFDTFGEVVGRLVGRVGSQLAPLFDRLGKVVASAAEQFDELVPKIETIVEVILKVGAVIVQVIAIAITPLINFIRNLLGPAFEFLGDIIISQINGAVDVIEGAVNIIMGLFSLVINLLTGDWGAAWESAKQIVEGVLQVIEGIIGAAFGAIEAAIQLFFGVIGAIFRTGWDTMVSIVEAVFEMIEGLISSGIQALEDLVVGLFNFYVSIWTTIFNTVVSIVTTLWNVVKGLFTNGVQAIKDFFAGIPGAIASFAVSIYNAAKNIGSKIIDGVVDGVKAIGGVATDIAGAILDGLRKVINPVIRTIESGINGAIDLANEIPFVDIDHVTLPKLHEGGIVPGPIGQEVLAILQGGEEVKSIRDVKNEESSGQNITIKSYLTVAPPEGMSKDDAMELARVTAAENARNIEAVIGTL